MKYKLCFNNKVTRRVTNEGLSKVHNIDINLECYKGWVILRGNIIRVAQSYLFNLRAKPLCRNLSLTVILPVLITL